MRSTKYFYIIIIAAFSLTVSQAHAHYPWLMMNNHAPELKSQAKAYIGWGHRFPMDGFLAKDRLVVISMTTPSGNNVALETEEGVLEYATPELTQSGSYIVTASQGKGYYTKLRKGGERAPKTGLKNVVRCAYSDNSMKTIFDVRQAGKVDKVFNHSLEIIPLSNPSTLREGDMLKVRVLHRGKPYDGMVFATYEGFSADGAYAYSVGTDDDGIASIRLLDRGRWLIRARAENAYPDPKVCDVEAFTGTLSFLLR